MSKISIIPLLFLLAATTGPSAAAQGATNPLLRCPLAAQQERPAAPGETEVGEVVTMTPRLEGRRQGGSPTPINKCSRVFKGMQVKSGDEAGARIAVNPRSPDNPRSPGELHPKKGYVLLGPETEVIFSEFVIGRALGQEPEMGFRMQLGQFRVALDPFSDELEEGEYWIEVPATPTRKKTRLRLAGTDVYVAADERGTTVAVFEGIVTVETAGRTVQLTAGTWTRATDDGPQPPMTFDPGVGKLSPSAGGPAFTVPGEMATFNPGLFVIDDIRLSLPK